MQNYEIYMDNGNGEKLFWRAGIPELMLSNIKYKPVAGSAGTLEFTVPYKHPEFNNIEPLNTDFWLYKNKERIFRGRYIGSKEDFFRSGQITCEGDLNFLVDSLQDPYEHQGDIKSFISQRIAVHNSRVESRKRFTVGNVTVTDSNNYLRRSNSKHSTTSETLKSKLVDSYGGYFRTRYVGDTTYLDYLINMGVCNQVIRFGENLLDIEKVIDPTSIITCLVPLGAELDENDEDTAFISEELPEGDAKRVDITSVNNGVKYIENAEGIKKWGRIWAVQYWDNVKDPNNLLQKAKTYLADQITLPAEITLTAMDLSLIQANVDDFEVGQYIKVESAFHGLKASDGGYILTKAEIDISNPANSKITLGGKQSSLALTTSRHHADITADLNDIRDSTSTEIVERIKATSNLITGGNGGYVKIHYADETDPKADHHPDEILIMDTDSVKTAKKVIRINNNGIGFSDQGYNPAKFATAWGIDSTFYANFITAGTMLAERIRGGVLEVGGTGLAKDGSIAVKDLTNAVKVLLDKNGIKITGGSIEMGSDKWDANGITINKGAISLGGGKWDASGITLPKNTIITGGMIHGETIQGTNFVAGGKNAGAAGIIYVRDANDKLRAALIKDGMILYNTDGTTKKLDATDNKMHFFGEVFRVYDSSGQGCFSSVVNTSHRVWADQNQSRVLSYVGKGGESECEGKGASESGILYLSGADSMIYLTGDKSDIVVNGESLLERVKALEEKIKDSK